jgi:DNA-binding IclR family transcriptional regulator
VGRSFTGPCAARAAGRAPPTTPDEEADVPSPAPAAERALRVLRYLASQPRPVPAATIARDLELPRSSTYHLLQVLEAERFVTHLPEAQRYGLGVAAFEIGSAYLRHDGLERLGQPLVATVAEETAGTAHLGVLDGREVLYLVKERPRQPDPVITEVGVRLPAHLTATGRALLAYLPAAQVTALFPTPAALSRRTDVGPATPSQLRARLRAVRDRGWASEEGEITAGFASVAVPAFDHTDRPAAAVAVTVRLDDLIADERRLADAVGRAAAQLTTRLGGGIGDRNERSAAAAALGIGARGGRRATLGGRPDG